MKKLSISCGSKYASKSIFSIFLGLFSISLLAWKSFPDGLFSLKEVGLFVVCSLICLMTFWKLHNKDLTYEITTMDVLVSVYLIGIPVYQYIYMPIVHHYSIWLSLGYAVIYYSVSLIAKHITLQRTAVSFWGVAIFILIINLGISFLQYVEAIPRYHYVTMISGMFFNPGPFAIYFASCLAIVVAVCFFSYSRYKYKFGQALSILIILGLWVLLELNSRSAWIGLLIAVFLLIAVCMLSLGYNFMHKHKRILVLCLFLTIAVLPFFAYFLYQMRPDSANGRILIWSTAWGMALNRPVFGEGIGNFAGRYPYAQGKLLQSDISLREKYESLAGETVYAFNDILHTIVEKGIIGGLLFVSIIILAGYKLYRCVVLRKGLIFWHGISVGLALLTIVIAGMAAYPLQMVPIAGWFWALVGLANATHGATRIKKVKKRSKIVLLSTFGCLTVLFACVGVYRFVGYYWWNRMGKGEIVETRFISMEHRLIGNGKFYADLGHYYRACNDWERALTFYKKAALYEFNKEYYYELGFCYEKLSYFDEALSCYELVENAVPSLIKPKYLIAKLYYTQGEMVLFNKKARDIILFKPKIYNSQHEMMIRELRFLLETSL